jgi:malate dehydrogenase
LLWLPSDRRCCYWRCRADRLCADVPDCQGDLLGCCKRVSLRLLEIPTALGALGGIAMELTDAAFPTLADVVTTDSPETAFKDADLAFLVGSFPRRDGMDRSDLLAKNGGIFRTQGEALSNFAKKTVKVLVVGNPANTNALIALKYATNLGPQNFSAMTRLDHNRGIGELSSKLGTTPGNVRNAYIWGNHSNTQVPDASNAIFDSPEGPKKVSELLPADYLLNEYVQRISTRGGAGLSLRVSHREGVRIVEQDRELVAKAVTLSIHSAAI